MLRIRRILIRCPYLDSVQCSFRENFMTKKAGPFNEFSYNAYFIPRPSPILPISIPLLLLLLIFSPAHSPYSSDWSRFPPTTTLPHCMYNFCTYKGNENVRGEEAGVKYYQLQLSDYLHIIYVYFHSPTMLILISCLLQQHTISFTVFS